MISRRVAENKIEGTSYSFSVLIKELDKNRILRHQITRSSWHDSSELIWWDCFKKMTRLCLCTCFHSASSILFRADNGRKKTHSDEDRWERYFQNEQIIFKKSCFPRHWRGPLNSCCNDTKHLSHVVSRMSHLRLFSSSTHYDSSMDVQGDYDPCDASGFIRINAVRLVSPQPVQNSLSMNLFQSLSYFLLFSTDWENTTACRVCPTQKIKEDGYKPNALQWSISIYQHY